MDHSLQAFYLRRSQCLDAMFAIQFAVDIKNNPFIFVVGMPHAREPTLNTLKWPRFKPF